MQNIKLLYTLIILSVFISLKLFSTDLKDEKITFLHFNDIYETLPANKKGGMGELMTLLERQRELYPDAITIVSGDFLFPSVISSITNGKHMIDLFNKMNIDFVMIGNHEFDMGPDVLLERMKESNFKWINSNVFDINNRPFGNSVTAAIKKIHGVNVGFFAVASPESATLSSPGSATQFTDPITSAKLAVKSLKERGVEVMVAITHLDFEDDVDLVKQVEGIDLVLGGHDHSPITWEEEGVLIQKSGTDGHYLGVIHLILDKDKKGQIKQIIPEWSMISSYGIPPSPTLIKDINRYQNILDKNLSNPLGKVKSQLDSRKEMVRTRETSMGNLVADIVRENLETDISIFNGGGIRGNRLYQPGTQITEGDIVRELPSSDFAVKVEISGKDLKAMLEHGVSDIKGRSGRFPQVSGIQMFVDRNAAPGNRIQKILVNGEPLDDNKVYSMATSSYIAGGGDGYKKISTDSYLATKNEGDLIYMLVIKSLRKQKTLDKKVENRIVFTQ